MTAAARKQQTRPDPLAVFIARAEARALLWQAGEYDLHEAVDELQAAAERDGLVAELGQDAIQAILAAAFKDPTASLRSTAEEAWEAPSWREAAVDYHKDRDGQASVVRYDAAELERLRALMDEDVSLDAAYAALSKPSGVAESTLKAAEHLLRHERDPKRLRAWLEGRSLSERAAIQKHLRGRR